MKKYSALVFTLILASTMVYADRQADQMLQLSQNGVASKTAEGEIETTFVDQNGNLKMMTKQAPTQPQADQK